MVLIVGSKTSGEKLLTAILPLVGKTIATIYKSTIQGHFDLISNMRQFEILSYIKAIAEVSFTKLCEVSCSGT